VTICAQEETATWDPGINSTYNGTC
jgi:hypothetical protein